MIVRISDPALAERLKDRATRENVHPARIVAEAVHAHLRRLDDTNGYLEPLR